MTDILLSGFALLFAARAIFYRAYFFAKQRHMGKDPKHVLKEEFPFMWWLF